MSMNVRLRVFEDFQRVALVFLALGVIVTGFVGMMVFGSVSVLAVEGGPGWEVTSSTFPTDLAPAGGKGAIEINVYNIGSEPSHGTVTVTDVLPAGVVATAAGDVQNGFAEVPGEYGLWDCSGIGTSVVTCHNDPVNMPVLPIPERLGSTISEAGSGAIEHIAIAVEVQTGTPGVLRNDATVAGGGALAPASTSAPVTISAPPASSFGFAGLDNWFSAPNGTVDTQAGSHPYEFVSSFDLNTVSNGFNLRPVGGEPRNVTLNLPPGWIGNPTAVPRCTRQQFEEEACSPSTQVGVDVGEALGGSLVAARLAFPVYNLVPPPGVPAQFGLELFGNEVLINAGLRSGGDYGISAHVNNVPQKVIMGNRIILWGEPADPSHNEDRFSKVESYNCGSGCLSGAPRVPFLTSPTSCGAPPLYTMFANTWETAGFGEATSVSHDASGTETGFTGCDHLTFSPSISVAPDTSKADTPAGLTVDVKAAQEGLTTQGALATSNIKNTTVVLAKDVVINPGQAAGLQTCGAAEDGLTSEAEKAKGEENTGPPSCPNASKVGTDEAETPILFKPLKGNVYVLQSNPPHLKLLAALSGEGVNVKLLLDVELDEHGQIKTTVLNVPQAPVSDFHISFTGGAQAALATPTHCGAYGPAQGMATDFTPWSTPTVGDAFPSSSFAIESGPGGAGCPPSLLPFTPALTAGSTTDQAGGFTNFSLLLQNSDDQKRTEKLGFQFPPGFLAFLGKVTLCPETQASTGACSDGSKIGHATVASGPGPYPLTIPQPGNPESPMYLTGPYNGTGACNVGEAGCAPFGLSIVTHVIAGPFNLGTIITRGKIEVDPRTAQITITTNPLPQVVDGVPTDLRLINAIADREAFLVNPTNCSPFSFTGTAWGTPPPGDSEPGVTVPISSHYQVGSCRSLGFSPSLTANTSGKTSKKNGASLSATLSYPPTTPGTGQATGQANIHTVKVELPKQLPSRLTTLQKACTAAQFNSDPAGCPPASIVGQALVHTPVLPVPLTGPAYFVSHGGEAFPALILVLQGYGVTVDVEATTFISKAGVTSLTFKTAPDAPFNTFTLTSPQGPYSALAANGNLCTSKLTMPTELVAQNGAVLHQTTKVNITGCPKSRLTRAQKLTKALKTCHKDKNKTHRKTCEKQAHKKYGPTNTHTKKKK